jgi:hypothetical protein
MSAANSAVITVLSVNGVKLVLGDLAGAFERTTG